jgi:aminopeptidase-like protein
MILNEFNYKTDNNAGYAIYQLVKELYPICRSITGDGVRETLNVLTKHVPLEVYEVPTGTRVFDWQVPKEWNIRDAWIKDDNGNVLLDFKTNNLHVLNYSIPVHMQVELEELKKNLYTLPEHPDWVPYKTSYYKETWGFCLSHRQLLSLKPGKYEVFIDSELKEGHLTYGELFIEGQSSEEFLISTHICHPSLCNDNLSGIGVATFLAKIISQNNPRYSYRFLFIPATIGSITWLALNEKATSAIKFGLVATLLGNDAGFTYKKSRQGEAPIDKAVEHFFKHSSIGGCIVPFSPFGYDERQYCSPGFNLPVGCLTRTTYGQFPEYHSSADNLSFISPEKLHEALNVFLLIISIIERNRTFINLNPKCEPQLGRRELYSTIGGKNEKQVDQLTLLWVLNMSDGTKSLLDIAELSNSPFDSIFESAKLLYDKDLIKPI